MENKNFTRLTFEQSDQTVVWEVPYEDVSTEDMMRAIHTIMIGATFYDFQVFKAMADYLNEYSDNKYEVVEKSTNEELEVDNDIKPHFYA